MSENGTKTDAIMKAVIAAIQNNRKQLDAAYWTGSSSVAVIVRLSKGKPFKVSFRTEAETDLVSG